MLLNGHYDQNADIAWLRFEGYDPATVVSEETSFGLRELDPSEGRVVGLEHWRASQTVPRELRDMLPGPPLDVVD